MFLCLSGEAWLVFWPSCVCGLQMQALSTQFKMNHRTCDIKGHFHRPVPDMVRHIHLSWHCLGAYDLADFAKRTWKCNFVLRVDNPFAVSHWCSTWATLNSPPVISSSLQANLEDDFQFWRTRWNNKTDRFLFVTSSTPNKWNAVKLHFLVLK